MAKKMILSTAYGVMLNEVNTDSICKVVADLFGFPCDYSPCEEELHDEGWKVQWCEENCGKATAADLIESMQAHLTRKGYDETKVGAEKCNT